jgi:hypothetical protein
MPRGRHETGAHPTLHFYKKNGDGKHVAAHPAPFCPIRRKIGKKVGYEAPACAKSLPIPFYEEKVSKII